MNCPKCSAFLAVWPPKKLHTCTKCGAKLKARNLGRALIAGFLVWAVVVTPLAFLLSVALIGSHFPLGFILDGAVGFAAFVSVVHGLTKYEVVGKHG